MKKTNKKKVDKSNEKKLKTLVEGFVEIFNELMLTPEGAALQRIGDHEVREKKFAQIMQANYGDHYENHLFYDLSEIPLGETYRIRDMEEQPFGQMRGICRSVMLEKLDRAGQLVFGLSAEEVQAAAQRENDLWDLGEAAGLDWALDHKRGDSLPPNWRISEAEMLACRFGVESQFETHGLSWLQGFVSGVNYVWDPPPPPRVHPL